MIRIVRDTDKLYALVLLHLLSPLALGAIQLDGKTLKRSSLGLASFSRVEPQAAQRGIPADRTADGIHRQGTSKEPRGIGVRFGGCLGRVLERGDACGGCLWRCRTKGERRQGIKERSCGLGKHEGTVLCEELMQAQVRRTQRRMRRQCRGGR